VGRQYSVVLPGSYGFAHAAPEQHAVPPVWQTRFGRRQAGGVPQVPELHVSPLQHVLEAEQLCPDIRHTGALPQVPELHVSPLQHVLDAEQLCPDIRHTGALPHVPELHVSPLQHVLNAEQLCPDIRHTGAAPHVPELHVSPLQHALEAEQLWPDERQVGAPWHRPVAELQVSPEQQAPPNAPLQSSPMFEQLPPPVPPMQPDEPQVFPPQQSELDEQLSPGSWQNCRSAQHVPFPQYMPVSQSSS
jgi:hypothetical protein